MELFKFSLPLAGPSRNASKREEVEAETAAAYKFAEERGKRYREKGAI